MNKSLRELPCAETDLQVGQRLWTYHDMLFYEQCIILMGGVLVQEICTSAT